MLKCFLFAQIPFVKDCGSDDKCTSDLKLTVKADDVPRWLFNIISVRIAIIKNDWQLEYNFNMALFWAKLPAHPCSQQELEQGA